MKFATHAVNHRALYLAGALLLGAATVHNLPCDATDEARSPIVASTEPVGAATQPVLMEPGGGPILWGFASATPQLEVTLDGRAHAFDHAARGTGAMIRVALATECSGGDLVIVRTAPGPRTVTHRHVAQGLTAYVPDGTYELATTCASGGGESTRLAITARSAR